MSSSQLFQPFKLGLHTLEHRVVLAPLTRYRADKSHVPLVPLVKEYYSQRSSTPGTLLITEATFIAAKAGGSANVPGIWSREQIDAWKEIVKGVHANGSVIFLQLWALGRTAQLEDLQADDPALDVVAPSPIPLASHPHPTPRELSVPEIEEFVQLYAQAAKNAVHEAGFDGVEIHGANGYLVDQFLEDVSNQRTDGYGGSIEARSRFGLEVVDAVVKAVGAERSAIRLSPWSNFLSMGMKDPIPQFSHFVSTLKATHPNLAYLHVVEPRIDGNVTRDAPPSELPEANDFIHDLWAPKPLIRAGGFTRDEAIKMADKTGNLIGFGRYYISNPDLPLRLKNDVPFTPYNRKTFYTHGDKEGCEIGYIDYPFYEGAKDRKVLRVRL